MNNRTSFALLTVLTIVGAITMSSAYAEQQAFVKDILTDVRITANEELLKDMPISVWTDKTNYEHNDMIMVTGQVANVASGFPVTVTVVSPLNSIVTIDQLTVADDSSFETTLNTAGAMWKYDGTYTIKVNYGSAEKSNSAKVELTGGVVYTPTYSTPTSEPEQIDEIQEKIDEIEKTNSENQYTTQEREWISSGPFQIDRSEYAIGEKIFIRIGGLELDMIGQIAVMRPLNVTHHKLYLTIPFDGSDKSAFNYYLEPQINTKRAICSTDDLLGEWFMVFRGTDIPNLSFKINEKVVPGTDVTSVC